MEAHRGGKPEEVEAEWDGENLKAHPTARARKLQSEREGVRRLEERLRNTRRELEEIRRREEIGEELSGRHR